MIETPCRCDHCGQTIYHAAVCEKDDEWAVHARCLDAFMDREVITVLLDTLATCRKALSDDAAEEDRREALLDAERAAAIAKGKVKL